MTTPHNAQTPQWLKITPDCQPVFPCWVWSMSLGGKAVHETISAATFDTHWHPDQPTAPEGGPFVPAPHGLSIAEAASGRSFGKPPPASPAATATPTPEYPTPLQIADAFGGCFTAFDVSGCADAIKRLIDQQLARLRAENKALRELLRRGSHMVVQFGSSIEQEPQAEAFAAEVEQHLAQHDSPGAHKKENA